MRPNCGHIKILQVVMFVRKVPAGHVGENFGNEERLGGEVDGHSQLG